MTLHEVPADHLAGAQARLEIHFVARDAGPSECCAERVSGTASKFSSPEPMDVTVRHTPLMATLSPMATSAITFSEVKKAWPPFPRRAF